MWWREDATERTLRRDERLWTAWTVATVVTFSAPAGLLVALEPLLFPVALICLAHAWAIPMLYARRGARSVVPIGSERSADRAPGRDPEAQRVALGLLGDLVGHEARELVAETGLVLERGRLGAWLIGEQGVFLVRSRGRRVDSWCVRIARAGRASGRRPRRPPAARAARGRARLREGREPRLLGRPVADQAPPRAARASGARGGAAPRKRLSRQAR